MKQKRIHVAQIVGNAENGGVEAMVMNFYRFIDHTRLSFDFFMHGNSSIITSEEVEKYGDRIIQIPSIKNIFKYKRVLKQNFNDNNYDIIHSNINTTNFVPLGVAKKAGIKVRIAHSHSTGNNKEPIRNLIKYLLKPFSKVNATDFFACSKKAGSWLFGKKFYDAGLVKLINNGVDFKKFAYNEDLREEIRNSLGIRKENFTIGHIGRFKTQKNHVFLIKLFSELKKLNNNVVLMLIGNGKKMQRIKRMVEKQKINDVHFLGVVSNPQDYYNAMDCFVLPSLYEGLPVVGVEAQCNGLKAFFSTNTTREARLLDSTEYISLKIGPKEWAKKINEFISGYKKERNSGELSVDFDIKNVAKKIESYYIEFLNKQKSGKEEF